MAAGADEVSLVLQRGGCFAPRGKWPADMEEVSREEKRDMEWLDIVDENGEPTGETVERERAHREGIRHRTAHVWLIREKDGRIQVLMQKRSRIKDSHPGCYDMSSGGHIPAGVDYLPSAVRELQEELGVTASEEELLYCGTRNYYWEDCFHGKLFRDRQVSRVYLLRQDPEHFVLQESEVEAVRWIDFEECRRAVRENLFPNCISLEELQMLADTFCIKKD